MSGPIVFISRNRIKDGMLEDFVKHYQASLPLTEDSKPQTVLQISYISNDRTQVTIVRLFQDAKGLDLQLQGADQRSKITYQYIEPTGIEIYGKPNNFALAMMNKVAGAGIEVTILPDYIGGFVRPQFSAKDQEALNLSVVDAGSRAA